MAIIKFKTKSYIDYSGQEVVKVPQLTRKHVDFNSCQSNKALWDFINSDMFSAVLARELKIHGIPKLLQVDALPEGVSIAPGFLKTVTITL